MKNKLVTTVAFALIMLNFISPVVGVKKAFAEEKKDYLSIGFDLIKNEAIAIWR